MRQGGCKLQRTWMIAIDHCGHLSIIEGKKKSPLPRREGGGREGEEALSRSVIGGKAKDGPRLGARSRADPRWPEGAVAVAQAVRQRGETLGSGP
ncbi:hypothetical protein BHE74_00038378 [Ensete ventricosum]|nr:hypothetical protein BHE74_00038378 [Ensete ventricosum]RZR94734.1 hypothetical protein BHM03_00023492 [Ensete ventricosum]